MELSKQSWFLGELTDDVAATTLKNSGGVNTYAVYKNVQKDDLILAVWQNEGVGTQVINFIDGSYQIEGQPDVHGDIITAVTCFANNHNLIPAFDGAVTTQLGLSIDVPPSYDQAERVLQPDIAPLPPIGEIEKSESEVIPMVASHPPLHGPHRHYYQNLHLCHPKNSVRTAPRVPPDSESASSARTQAPSPKPESPNLIS
ncbi:hypothetical protein EMCRGX_G010472 [Ephydatia muelleri]